MEIEIFTLKLVSPLFYIPSNELDPFDGGQIKNTNIDTERLFCFELDEDEAASFEPNREKFPGKLVSGGIAAKSGQDGKAFKLPEGDYLFAQKREIPGRKEIISMAVEIQSEGLWRRLVPGKMLYLRYLFEDGSWVTQLLRPFRGGQT